jgi:excisionase family DNA binding protein
MTDTMLTKKQVAERLNISVWATGQLISKGLLPMVPVGFRVRIRPEDVERYIAENICKSDQAAPDQEIIVISAYESSV